MKIIVVFFCLAFCHPILLCQEKMETIIELVESIPIGTNLDNPDIRDTYEVWFEMINNVKSSLDIEQFYISNEKGEPLEGIIDAIIEISKRGASIRIIVDSRMYKTYPETVDLLRQQKNISVRIINLSKLGGGVQHSKYFIVDGEGIFIGSQNFDWRALKHIHEIGIRIKHKELVAIYQDIFNLDWQLAENNNYLEISKNLTRKKYSLPIVETFNNGQELVLTPTMSPKELIYDSTLWDETHIVNLIDRAKREIRCQFLTYSPIGRDKNFYPILDNALRRAAVRGVKIKMVVSDWAKDHPTVDHLKSLSLVPNIQIKFSSIPEWLGGYIPYARVEHCKFLIIDSTDCWIGTSNWEKSYFYTSRNLGIVINNQMITSTLLRIFLKTWDGRYTESIKSEVEYSIRKHTE